MSKDKNIKSKEIQDEYKFRGSGLTAKEKHWAEKRFLEYKKHHHITSWSDMQLLEEVVYQEALSERQKLKIEELTANKILKDNELIKKGDTEVLNNINEQILELKEKLGLFNTDKNNDDPYTEIEKLEKKFKIWCANNQASRQGICPHCSKPFLLYIRTEAWEFKKHPFFKDRLLGNEHLIKLYKEKKITADDVAKILGTSSDYTEWLITKWDYKASTESTDSNVNRS